MRCDVDAGHDAGPRRRGASCHDAVLQPTGVIGSSSSRGADGRTETKTAGAWYIEITEPRHSKHTDDRVYTASCSLCAPTVPLHSNKFV